MSHQNHVEVKQTREQFLLECRRQFHDHLRNRGLVGYMRDFYSGAPVGVMIAKENKEDGYIYLGWSKVNVKSSDRWNKYEGFHHAIPRLVRFAKIGTKFHCCDDIYHAILNMCYTNQWRTDIAYPMENMAHRALTYYKETI